MCTNIRLVCSSSSSTLCCRAAFDAQGGYVWTVVFNSSMGDVPQMTAYSALTPSTYVNIATATTQVPYPSPYSHVPNHTRIVCLMDVLPCSRQSVLVPFYRVAPSLHPPPTHRSLALVSPLTRMATCWAGVSA